MKVVFVKNNNFIKCYKLNIDGYKFIPRKKKIKSLLIVDKEFIKCILKKKIEKDINKIEKTIKLMINSDYTIYSDCYLMQSELKRIINLIDVKYITYFNEFEFFKYIKKIYILNMVLNLKKNMINEVI